MKMSTLKHIRIQLIENMIAKDIGTLPIKLEEFIREYRVEMKNLQPSSKNTRPVFRPNWNTPVSPFTGVVLDGSDGECHAPLRNSTPIFYECFLAQTFLDEIEENTEIDEDLYIKFLSVLRDACIA